MSKEIKLIKMMPVIVKKERAVNGCYLPLPGGYFI
jgi:hypothetical protein